MSVDIACALCQVAMSDDAAVCPACTAKTYIELQGRQRIQDMEPGASLVEDVFLTVRDKRIGDLYYDMGSSDGYAVVGKSQRPYDMMLVYGITYNIYMETQLHDMHPIALSNEPKGGRNMKHANLVARTPFEYNRHGTQGIALHLDTTKLKPGATYHLVCLAHPYMGFPVHIAQPETRVKINGHAALMQHRCDHAHYVPGSQVDFVDHIDSRTPDNQTPLHRTPDDRTETRVMVIGIGDMLPYETHTIMTQHTYVMTGYGQISYLDDTNPPGGPTTALAPRTYTLTPGTLAVIPPFKRHRIENTGEIPMKILSIYSKDSTEPSWKH